MIQTSKKILQSTQAQYQTGFQIKTKSYYCVEFYQTWVTHRIGSQSMAVNIAKHINIMFASGLGCAI